MASAQADAEALKSFLVDQRTKEQRSALRGRAQGPVSMPVNAVSPVSGRKPGQAGPDLRQEEPGMEGNRVRKPPKPRKTRHRGRYR